MVTNKGCLDEDLDEPGHVPHRSLRNSPRVMLVWEGEGGVWSVDHQSSTRGDGVVEEDGRREG